MNKTILPLLVTAVAACAGASPERPAPARAQPRPASELVDTAAMHAHLRFLAADRLEGRAPATRGGQLTTEYIATQYKTMGLQPAGPSGSYYQPVPLVGMTPRPTFVWGKE